MDFTYMNMLAQLNVASAHPGGFTATKKAWEKLKNFRHDVILDAGCGTGKTLAYLANKTNSQLIGVDQLEAMIKKASQRLQHTSVKLHLANIGSLPLENETIDCIISESVISFNNVRDCLAEYHRVLRPGGTLYIVEITACDTLTFSEQDEINQFYGTQSILTADEWNKLIKQAGFNVIESSPLPATADGQIELEFNDQINSIYIDYLSHHYHLINILQTKLMGQQFFCQKK